MSLWNYIASLKNRPLVRPWALAVPIVVLLLALPLLRPLRHPMSWQISTGEMSRLATIQAIVEHRTLAIDNTSFATTSDRIVVDGQHFSDQPPMLAVLLSPAYAIMHRLGYTLPDNPTLVAYLLTILGATLPVVVSAGLIYRMGRLFELPRKWRTLLAATVVFGSGLFVYAVVLNAHAPAAFLVLAAAACLIQAASRPRPVRATGWLILAGLCAAFAAAIDLPAVAFLALFPLVIATMRRSFLLRTGGVGLYLLGVLPVLALQAWLMAPITGDLLPPTLHPELARQASILPARQALSVDLPARNLDDDVPLKAPLPEYGVRATLRRTFLALFGDHGAVSHFPILIIAIFGTAAVMHRHWPVSTKMLAVITLAGSAAIVVGCAMIRPDWTHAMFGARWFIVFLPLLIFWCGAWMRRSHHPFAWAMAGLLLAFSVAVSLLGATDPAPRDGFDTYTPAVALHELLHPTTNPPTTLAGG